MEVRRLFRELHFIQKSIFGINESPGQRRHQQKKKPQPVSRPSAPLGIKAIVDPFVVRIPLYMDPFVDGSRCRWVPL